jgi:NRAMP (natural resistance-associated macrophage protein)-like metal ion transporter
MNDELTNSEPTTAATWKSHGAKILSRTRMTRRRLALFLAVVGPGLITSNVDNDAGGITTYTLAGARFGPNLLWSLIPITLALIVVQEMCARMGAVTGRGLADLIRESWGVKVTFWMMIGLLISNLGNTVAEFAGVSASLSIFGVPPWVSVPTAAILVWVLVLKGSARVVEKIFLVACLVYLAYPISGFLAHPDWTEVLKDTVVPPRVKWDGTYVAMLIGLVGTTIAPWMQFYLQSAVVEKGVKPEQYAASRLDVIVGCIFTDVVAFFIVVACAATLYKSGTAVDSAEAAAIALRPLAGAYASWLFAFGLFNASLFAASILPLATAYSVCEAFGWETGIDRKYHEARQFYWLYSGIVAIGAAVVLIPHIPMIPIMYVTQIANGVLLPFVLIFMLLLANREKLMGVYKNGPWLNAVAWGTTVVMIGLTGYLIFDQTRSIFTSSR